MKALSRIVLATTAAIFVAPPAITLLIGLGLPAPVAAGLAAVAGSLALYLGRARIDRAAEAAFGSSRLLLAAWTLLALGAAGLLVQLDAFVLDPSVARLSVVPGSGFFSHHYCYTAYREAVGFAGAAVPNVYAPDLYAGAHGPRMLDGFSVDDYYYPPPFLLLPALVRAVTRDFLHERMVWYALAFASIAAAMMLAAHFVGGRVGRNAALLAVAVVLAVPARLALQVGNFQAIAVAWTILAMLAFEWKRPAIGGALLAFTMLAKLYPGILLLYLIGARRWREAAWTTAWSALYIVVFVARWGSSPFDAFVHFTLPRLSSGEAFGMLRTFPWAVTINQSIFGAVLKLRMLGATWASFEVASIVTWIYTVLIVVAALAFGRLDAPRDARVRVWLALLALAAMRSPFLPIGYALFAPLWLLTMCAAELMERASASARASKETRGARGALRAAGVALAWGAFAIVLPPESFRVYGPKVALAVGMMPQIAALVVCGWALLQGARARKMVAPAALLASRCGV